MINNKNILIAIDNGIIALDVKRQLNEAGYNAEIMNLASRKKLTENLIMNFQLIILEKSEYEDEMEYAAGLAQDYSIPIIFLASDHSSEKIDNAESKFLMMPFGENELKEVVKIALGDGKVI